MELIKLSHFSNHLPAIYNLSAKRLPTCVHLERVLFYKNNCFIPRVRPPARAIARSFAIPQFGAVH